MAQNDGLRKPESLILFSCRETCVMDSFLSSHSKLAEILKKRPDSQGYVHFNVSAPFLPFFPFSPFFSTEKLSNPEKRPA